MAYATILMHYKHKRVIEIGSGFTSALALDVRENFLPDLNCTFIDPNTKQLSGLFTEHDWLSSRIIPKNVQEVSLSDFDVLEANDILFIDSSHVAKAGSDVCFEFFQILPRLAPGVLVHFHDIFYPFEYLEEWVLGGVSWNETYLVRALLGGGDRWQIVFFTDFMNRFYPVEMAQKFPGSEKNTGGSLWIRRVSN